MDAKELVKMIGRTGVYKIERRALSFAVKVTDARYSYGRADLKVKPIAGAGEDWVMLRTVTLDPKKEAK